MPGVQACGGRVKGTVCTPGLGEPRGPCRRRYMLSSSHVQGLDDPPTCGRADPAAGVKPGLVGLRLSALASPGCLGVPGRQSVWERVDVCMHGHTRRHGHTHNRDTDGTRVHVHRHAHVHTHADRHTHNRDTDGAHRHGQSTCARTQTHADSTCACTQTHRHRHTHNTDTDRHGWSTRRHGWSTCTCTQTHRQHTCTHTGTCHTDTDRTHVHVHRHTYPALGWIHGGRVSSDRVTSCVPCGRRTGEGFWEGRVACP